MPIPRSAHAPRRFVTTGSLLLALGVVAPVVAQGQAALAADLNTQPPVGSDPLPLGFLGSTLLFRARTPAEGAELWASGIAVGGTSLLKDVHPSGDGNPERMVSLGGVVLFVAFTPATGRELWRSDGTTAGTVLVKDIRPGSGDSGIDDIQVVGNVAYFRANDGATGIELWRSDGSAAGTTLVADLSPGVASANPQWIRASGSTVYFFATTPNTGAELWKSDGTSAGTVLVRDIQPGTAGSSPSSLTVIGSLLLFAANDGSAGDELWRTDGTAAGTIRISDLNPGSASASPQWLRPMGSQCAFTAVTPNGRVLCASGGTAASTRVVVVNAVASDAPVDLTPVGITRVVFRQTVSGVGNELFVTDGTAPGTNLLRDIAPGSASAGIQGLVPIGSEVWFSANDGVTGSELWRTNGTAAGTQRVADLRPGAASSSPYGFLGSPSEPFVYFAATDQLVGTELWRVEINSLAIEVVRDIDARRGASEPDGLVSVPMRPWVFFAANDGVRGREPWLADANGIQALGDLRAGAAGSDPAEFTWADPECFFVADDGVHGRELWTSAGNALSTGLRADLLPGAAGSNPHDLTAFGDRVAFRATDAMGVDLFVVGRGIAGVRALDQVTSVFSSLQRPLVAAQDRVYFAVQTFIQNVETVSVACTDGMTVTTCGTSSQGAIIFPTGAFGLTAAGPDAFFFLRSGTELWRGTPGGGSRITTLPVGISAYHSACFTGGTYYFYVRNLFPPELWRSDGTAAGTTRLVLLSNSFTPRLSRFHAAPRRVFFAVDSGVWTSDGVNTVQLRDHAAATVILDDAHLLGALFFYVVTQPNGLAELWRTDGTVAGTYSLLTAVPGGIDIHPPLPGAGRVLFTAQGSSAHGRELWRSDGTVAGTVLHQDLHPGPRSGSPGAPVLYGQNLLVVAEHSAADREPWVMRSNAAAVPYGRGCTGGAPREPVLSTRRVPQLPEPAFGLVVSDGWPGSVALFGLDHTRGSGLSITPGCGLWLASIPVSFALPTDGSGGATLSLPLPPAPNLIGTSLFVQAFVRNLGGSAPFAFTHALQLLLADG